MISPIMFSWIVCVCVVLFLSSVYFVLFQFDCFLFFNLPVLFSNERE